MNDFFNARDILKVGDRKYTIYRLEALEEAGFTDLKRLPFSIRIMLEAALRQCNDKEITQQDVKNIAAWTPTPLASPLKGGQSSLPPLGGTGGGARPGIPFLPARVVMQDFTGVPAVVDLAAMRSAVARLGGDPKKINPLVPVDLVIDHSIQVDFFATQDALQRNTEIEFQRNRERYEFLKWGQQAFSNFRVVPPMTGIVHQVNLEYLAQVIMTRPETSEVSKTSEVLAFPDTLVGTDSHTTMINGLGVLGWGVGGIEAEAVMLGQPMDMLLPDVIGFKLYGKLREGVTATDLVLTVTQILRAKGVVDKFVEFFGAGLDTMSVADRATIGNMAPEYGATIGFFPVDAETLRYMKLTGRPDEVIERTEAYCRQQKLFRDSSTPDPEFTDTLELDLGSVVPSLAGPKRPQDRVPMSEMRASFQKALTAPVKERGFELKPEAVNTEASFGTNGGSMKIKHGAVVIAAITSCTNTSNPSVMVGAGLLARKAVEKGLTVKPYVKTSLAPGSRVVTEYLRQAGLIEPLSKLGFNLVAYGCTTCIAAGTPVLLANGTARRIEQMPSAGGAVLFGPTADTTLSMALQTEAMDQGVRECVSLVLQDGRIMTCTPEHEILHADGRWVRADQLVPGRDRVVVGLEAPLDDPGADEASYILHAGDTKLSLGTPQDRLHMLAFARLVGHLLSDGSISIQGQGRMNVGQAVDRQVVLNDIELLTGMRPVAKRYDERKWAIVLPMQLTKAISALPGVRVGRRIDQPPKLPAFVLDERCPVAVVREFLGGFFGADGHAPVLHRWGKDEEQSMLEPPRFSQSVKPEHKEILKQVMGDIVRLLARCGVETHGARIYEYPTRRAVSSYSAAQDGIPRVEVRLHLPDGLSFVERVGFRYSVDKQMRASAAAVYWRTVKMINEQRLWMSGRLEELHETQRGMSFSRARQMAAAELTQREAVIFPHYALLEGHDRFTRLPRTTARKFRPLHRVSCDFLSPVEMFRQMGVREWFAPLRSRVETDSAKRYCVEKEALTLPTFTLQVVDRKPAGRRHVFDLAVDNTHAFMAGSTAVHNCIGNSGPLPGEVAKAVTGSDLVTAAVLSGNRNFEGRINPLVKASYLASPPLVVAYALAGTVDIDLDKEPLGTGSDGQPVYLHDLWPTQQEISEIIASSLDDGMFKERYSSVFEGSELWKAIRVSGGDLYEWDEASTYIHHPPYFQNLTLAMPSVSGIQGARALAVFGDSITTDHISPAGNIATDSPAGRYLQERGVQPKDFNSYGARRGNDLVMVRGTFANIRLKNLLVVPKEGNWTKHFPDGEEMSIFDAALKYQGEGVPSIVLAGKEYGSGSSRDWAAKGPNLQGVRAVIAESFERIHRSNLVGMGVLPLKFMDGENIESLGLKGDEVFDIQGLSEKIQPKSVMKMKAKKSDGKTVEFKVTALLNTEVEVNYYRNGGILHAVLRNLVAG